MNPDPAPSSAPAARPELTAAFLLLRLFLGLRTLFAGVEKFELGGTYSMDNYTKTMTRIATGITDSSFLPLWATKAFAFSLGYVLLAVGAAILLGVKPRCSLCVGGLVYVGLAFGLMAVQDNAGIAWLAIHVGLFAGALALVRYSRFSVWPDRQG